MSNKVEQCKLPISRTDEFSNFIENIIIFEESKLSIDKYKLLKQVIEKFGTYFELDNEFAICVIDLKKE